ncbi:ECF-type sigma factor [Acanthopleuribacter pedis]|uniref:Sigma-70 family RNA polymerase sigma factor n=1 Tax=Acanthopleuribacter pedis TaxID=442870 RepID=A0A8J7Q5Q6_9BACT|nr:sigma-70 family RNA polymerase sigma factor [Acanthopleuribacter pedis]MBO1318627.1 sigma-70 family RNA polymerase sigma factor [Acanthopleuribacter pedis]
MSASPPNDEAITQLLESWQQGDQQAFDELLPLVYTRLKAMSRNFLRNERANHTLSATALVHEAYFKMVEHDRMRWQDRAHFFAVTATVMRRILLNHARNRKAQKRGGGEVNLTFDEAHDLLPSPEVDVLALEDVLQKLSEKDPRKGKIVEMRVYGGLTEEEVAEVLKVSAPTVRREWRAARAWLFQALS